MIRQFQIFLRNFSNFCVVGLIADPERLSEVRKTRASVNQAIDLKAYTDVEAIEVEVENSKKMMKQYNWPTIDVTRRSVEETAASIIKNIQNKRKQMKIILASVSGVRKKFLDQNNI